MKNKSNQISESALDNFVYLVGMPRGGTSVLRNAVNTHEEILLLPEISHFLNHVWRYRKVIHKRLLKVIFQHQVFYNEDSVIASLPEEDRSPLLRKIKKDFDSDDLARMYKLYPLLYSMDETCHKNIDDIKCWGDKSNNFAGIEDVPKAFPNSKIILIVRDPRSNVLSLTKRAKFKEEFDRGFESSDYEYIRSCFVWNGFNRRISKLSKKYESNVKVIRFEDFLEKPEKTLNAVFKFILGQELSQSKISEKINQLNYGESNKKVVGEKGISKKALARWKKELSEEKINLIETICGSVAISFSYEIEKKGFFANLRHIKKLSSNKQKVIFIYLLVKDSLANLFLTKTSFDAK